MLVSRTPQLMLADRSCFLTQILTRNPHARRQERAAQLAEHEESLDAWKRQFKEQAMQQIGDRKRALTEWQAKLEGQDADLAQRRAAFEVRRAARCRVVVGKYV